MPGRAFSGLSRFLPYLCLRGTAAQSGGFSGYRKSRPVHGHQQFDRLVRLRFRGGEPGGIGPDHSCEYNRSKLGRLKPQSSAGSEYWQPGMAFAYASDDTNFSTDPPTLTAVNLGSYIAPGSFEDRFFFGTQQQASHYGLLVVAVVDQETVYESGQRSRDGHRYANPGCTSTFCGRTWPDWITRTSQEADENRLI